MGRPRLYEKPVNKTIIAEEDDLEELKVLNIKPQEVWEAGVKVVKPSGMSAQEYRIRQLNREKTKIKEKYSAEILLLEETRQRELEDIQREMEALQVQKKVVEEGFDKLWEIFIKEHPQLIKQKPRWDPNDGSIHPWWEEHGYPVTYGRLRKKFDEEGT